MEWIYEREFNNRQKKTRKDRRRPNISQVRAGKDRYRRNDESPDIWCYDVDMYENPFHGGV